MPAMWGIGFRAFCTPMNTVRETWRKNWLECIAELTSVELQRTAWLDTENQNPHWSFTEFMSCYFDDCRCDDYGYRLSHGYLTDQELEAIKPWHELLDEYRCPNNDWWNHSAILEDPKWLAIVAAGVHAKQRLQVLLTPVELDILDDAVIYPGPSKWP